MTIDDPAPTVTDLPIPNLPLLRKVLDHIDAHPDEWRQDEWYSDAPDLQRAGLSVPECGTAHCIAGHVVAMTEGVNKRYGIRVPASGRDWADAARDHLGLAEEEAGDGSDPGLFYSLNTRDDVQGIAKSIAARAGEVL